MRSRPLESSASRSNHWNVLGGKVRSASAVFVLLLSLIVLHPFSATRPDGKLHIDFLDVGQGDAALVTMPDGTLCW